MAYQPLQPALYQPTASAESVSAFAAAERMPIDRVALAVDQPLQPVEFQPEAFSDCGSALVLTELTPIDRAALAVVQPLQPVECQPEAFSDCGSAFVLTEPVPIDRAALAAEALSDCGSTFALAERIPIDGGGPAAFQPLPQPLDHPPILSDLVTPEAAGEATAIDRVAGAVDQPLQPLEYQPDAFSDWGSAPAPIARAEVACAMGPPTHQPAIQPATPSAFASTPAEGERAFIDGTALALFQPPQPVLDQPEAFSDPGAAPASIARTPVNRTTADQPLLIQPEAFWAAFSDCGSAACRRVRISGGVVAGGRGRCQPAHPPPHHPAELSAAKA